MTQGHISPIDRKQIHCLSQLPKEELVELRVPFHLDVEGGVKVRRVAVQNRGTSALFTPSDPGCQSVIVHFFYSSSGSIPA
jgi:hypothetical protein